MTKQHDEHIDYLRKQLSRQMLLKWRRVKGSVLKKPLSREQEQLAIEDFLARKKKD